MFEFLKNLFSSNRMNMQEIIAQGATIVDVRTPAEFAGGHIKGSVNIPLDQLRSRINELKGKKAIITCCASGIRSASAKAMLESHGITNVYNGGGWASLNRFV